MPCLSVLIIRCGAHPKIALDKIEFLKEEKAITINFSKAVVNSTDSKYWACIIPSKSKDSEWEAWIYVPDNAESITINLKKEYIAGDYEIRLHSDYPKKKFNVVDRKAIVIQEYVASIK